MQLATYRVFGAMAALREFNIAKLSQVSGVSPTTVRTVLRRHPGLIETIPSQSLTQRGGQSKRYQVREPAMEKLYLRLSVLARAAQKASVLSPERNSVQVVKWDERGPGITEIPLPLLVGAETMLFSLTKANSLEAQEKLVSSANNDMLIGLGELPLVRGAQTRKQAQAYANFLACLITVATFKLQIQPSSELHPRKLQELCSSVNEALRDYNNIEFDEWEVICERWSEARCRTEGLLSRALVYFAAILDARIRAAALVKYLPSNPIYSSWPPLNS
jgi:hypothetical protein